jgi:hypothetical protein
MNLLRVAILALLLPPAAQAQAQGTAKMMVVPNLVVSPATQPQPVLAPVVRPEPKMLVVPAPETKPPVMVKAPGAPAYRPELPAVQRPGEIAKPGAPRLTPLDDLSPRKTGSAADKDLQREQAKMQDEHKDFKMDMMKLQDAEQQQTRQYNTISNASKKRHDAARKAIENMR